MSNKSTLINSLFIIMVLISSKIVYANSLDKSIINNIEVYQLTDIISTYTTYFDKGEMNRYKNIAISSKKINGQLIMPGEIFSFNEVVGPRTKDAGYKEAIEIINGEFVQGIGGGICQVSSTLYNSVLLANLEIIERDNHSRPVSYIPMGRGATVYYNYIDFKFRNNSDSPIIIIAKIVKNKLTITVLGKDKGEYVEIITSAKKVLKPKVLREIDRGLPSGTEEIVEPGAKGFEILVRRVVKKGNKIIKNEFVSKDIYSPKDTIIKINPKN
ncbi:surface rod structure-forming protein G [Orenia metallireducens]|uniref:G5 domain-containing protein n=1 Tax=Orenia metallireducens TaxID=1413210 RepID=A0A285HB00_9FIRM|nr:VanW family protein [Orenia metallireducens]PRX26188.1 surface rod structure-forming protein G [Orenia metallireducens]SNY32006.1 G5 domain-containing protein [Orenia metallireducens]